MKLALFLLGIAVSCMAGDAPTAKVSAYFDPSVNPEVKRIARELLSHGRVVGSIDAVTDLLYVGLPYEPDHNVVGLSVFKKPDGKPTLVLGTVYNSRGWIFARSADFRIGTNIVTLVCDSPKRSVMDGGEVFEAMSWTVRSKKLEDLVKAIASGKCLVCLLRGSEGDARANFYPQDFHNILTVYFALGGPPLNQE